MSIRALRESKLLSQEQLAQVSGLSLRTIQRAEAGHRVSYATLRILAASFDVDVDSLERELYAMNKTTDEFIEIPRWVRIMHGKGLYRPLQPAMTRRDTHILETVFLVLAVVLFAASFFVEQQRVGQMLRYGALVELAACYLISISVRITDTYKLWPAEEEKASHGFFGFKAKK